VSQSLASRKIAKRYVNSLFADVSKKADIDSIAKDMSDLGAMIQNSDELAAFLKSPLHGTDTQMNVVEALAKKAKLSAQVTSLLQVLVKNRRLNILQTIIFETETYLAKASGTVPVSIASARALTATDQKKIQTQIKAVLGKDVIMQSYVDESLIGGLVIQVESTLIDGSIKTKLDKLERQLVGKAA
jgi:F-type H+-transporting ATPase subunit delta